MAFRINDNCQLCQKCVDECPLGCISVAGDKCEINEDECVGCGCCAGVCEFDAIEEA